MANVLCEFVVGTSMIVLVVAGPIALIRRATASQRRGVAVGAMVVVGVVAYAVVGVTWTVWAFAAQAVCRP
jgi:hypothetical protein